MNLSETPWLVYDAIDYINSLIKPYHNMFEYGCGGSTIYYHNKVKHLRSVEHDVNWANNTLKKLSKNNVDLIQHEVKKKTKDNLCSYANVINNYQDYYDIILIDGLYRNKCIANAINKLKKNGIIILDNSNRKEYQQGKDLLSKWSRVSFYGFGPRLNYRWETTIYKNDSIL